MFYLTMHSTHFNMVILDLDEILEFKKFSEAVLCFRLSFEQRHINMAQAM